MSVTAIDYLEQQLALEREAKEAMPFDPNECTYTMGPIRQMVYACLTCGSALSPVGVCYSCLIRCHSTHELVELFSKRGFACDCGTTRVAVNGSTGGCVVRAQTEQTTSSSPNASSNANSMASVRPRSGSLELGGASFRPRLHSTSAGSADDIPSSSNRYNQNFEGRFCGCHKLYNPLEETGTMIQCYLGTECGEDWYHLPCVVGLDAASEKTTDPGSGNDTAATTSTGNILDTLSGPGEDAVEDAKNNGSRPEEGDDNNSDDEELAIPYFPALGSFDQFICWKCVEQAQLVFDVLRTNTDIVKQTLPHFAGLVLTEEWETAYETRWNNPGESESNNSESEPKAKRTKNQSVSYSVFLANSFRAPLIALKESLKEDDPVARFLESNSYLYASDPVYEPPKEEDSASSTGSLLDLGTDVLLSLPREQAVEGLQAYNMIKSKLRDFFKPFAEQGKVVTEEEIRDFFSKVKNKQ